MGFDLTAVSDPTAPGIDPTPENLAELAELAALGEQMLAGYVERYGRADLANYDVEAVEVPFSIPIIRPGAKAALPEPNAGVIDLVIRDKRDRLLYLVDHKTYAPGRFDEFRNNLAIDEQVTRYMAAWEDLKGERPAGFFYNVLVKQAPREPDLLKKGGLSKDKRQITTAALYRAAIARHGLDEAEYRDFIEFLEAYPREFFHRELVIRTAAELAEFRAITAARVDEARNATVWRNPGPWCSGCSYKPVCEHDTPEARAGFRVAKNPHEELVEAGAQATAAAWSHSRTAAWLLCRMKEKLAYRDGLKPLRERPKLAFGTCIHAGLAAFYRSGGVENPVLVFREKWASAHVALTGREPMTEGEVASRSESPF